MPPVLKQTLTSNLLQSLSVAKGKGHQFGELLHNFLTQNQDASLPNLAAFLPLLFQRDGKAVTLEDHFVMEPLFNRVMPRNVTLMCSRQVGKSMQVAMRALLNCAWTPHWSVLFCAPMFETIRRISSQYFADFMETSPCSGIFNGKGCVKQVLERSLPNKSRIQFTYALRDANRARGITAQELFCDEYQLMLSEVMPVLTAVMQASPYGNYITRSGTPLTNANPLSVSFKEDSSRSHWMIKCRSCGKENIAAHEYDLMNMIGKLRGDISPRS